MQNKGDLQDKFTDFGAQPTDALWDSIASNLDTKRNKKVILSWWIGSGIVAILGLGLGVFIYFYDTKLNLASIDGVDEHKTINSHLYLEKETSHLKDTIQPIKIKTQKGQSGTTELTSQNIINNVDRIEVKAHSKPLTTLPKVKTTNTQPKSQLFFDHLKAKSKQHLIPEKSNTEGVTLLYTDEEEDLNSVKVNTQFVTLTTTNERQLVCEECDSVMSARSIAEITLVFNQNLGLNKLSMPRKRKQFEYSLNTVTFFNSKNIDQQTYASINTNGFTYTADESLTASNNTQFKTSIPLVLRFGIATPLFKRFKIQTGLDFGWIHSKPLNSENLYQRSSIFTLGIPVLLKFNFVTKKRFDVTVNIGIVNDFTILNQDKPYEKSTFTLTKGFLGGAEVGFNFDYKLTEKLKLGIGTGVRTYYYQSKPILNFTTGKNAFYSLNFGLTWNY